MHRIPVRRQYEAIETVLARFREALPPIAEDLPDPLRRVLTHVHAQLFSPDLSVLAVRRECRLRNNNLSSWFRSILGLGIHDYIEKRRLEAACALLRATTAEVYLIAFAVGYRHQETFCRAFSRELEDTPARWRARNQEESSRSDGERGVLGRPYCTPRVSRRGEGGNEDGRWDHSVPVGGGSPVQ